ncbi:hypothetical protein HOU02_gp173 [Caulobacter phage CcrBL9]|uniref:Uncharacterized protein n=1 Tax=Caulobacter phage CcrBL9 TaxID=2283270 RepID=A0A385EBE9_9CAUD|nr:hypothetical protein HOU02_gp012 [Caulobacter phage CcrBL9]YP_009810182.1 hypothetical protein HOU02_gp173 [Caulobacter phage CcrBL9]AXQ69036.1 hypothetical protein CcrBL9_gp012 [Caulobacter phage CcrBL9]AXQ69552.1 hypothetical protein CcrBL9_gp528 [Caulobacter phage CcrBL9]
MSARERRALAELLALFHAVNSGHVKGRNPYAFPAVKLANAALTGDPLDGGFHVAEALDTLRTSDGKALLFDTEFPEESG